MTQETDRSGFKREMLAVVPHLRAFARGLCGRADEAYGLYDQLVKNNRSGQLLTFGKVGFFQVGLDTLGAGCVDFLDGLEHPLGCLGNVRSDLIIILGHGNSFG